MLEDAWPEHTARPKEVRGAAASKPALRMSALDECDKCHHTRVMHPVDGLCGVLLFDDQPCNCDHFWPGKGTPCCRCNGSVTASIGCECEHHLVPTTVCPRCQQTFPFITDLREPGGGYMAFHECVPPDTRPATMMQPVDISFDEQTNDNTAGQSIPSDHRMVNLTNVQECDYCGCLIVNPERHQCMARAITNAHREMTKEHDDDTWGL
jgi:ribosomal protein L32